MRLTDQIKNLYPPCQWEYQQERINQGIAQFQALFGRKEPMIFSAPGRSEICGNHTDHNYGKAVGASIDLDLLVFATPRADGIIRIISEGYLPFEVDTNDLNQKTEEKGTSAALVRGIAFKMKQAGFRIGGLDAYTTSNVAKGSGLSSSAAFEVAILCVLDHLYNEGKLPPIEMAKMAQFAENIYFGKGSGLLDQLSCAFGGMIAIDFEDPADPKVSPIPFDFQSSGYDMVITDVRSDHADLTADYDAIKDEMHSVAKQFGKEHLRAVCEAEFEERLPELRQALSERAILRAIHFFAENKRVDELQDALKQKDFDAFRAIVRASGNSSCKYLQNIYSVQNPCAQALPLALCIAEQQLGEEGAFRVHGGGFGGTIQAYVPKENTLTYCAAMEQFFGEGCCHILQIRDCGPIRLN